jgi:hypothetical protein
MDLDRGVVVVTQPDIQHEVAAHTPVVLQKKPYSSRFDLCFGAPNEMLIWFGMFASASARVEYVNPGSAGSHDSVLRLPAEAGFDEMPIDAAAELLVEAQRAARQVVDFGTGRAEPEAPGC